jgi:GAF domain-containing protein
MTTSKTELYDQLAAQLSSLLAGERDLIANTANFSSLIFQSLPDLNWAGFYFAKDGELVLRSVSGKARLCAHQAGSGSLRRRSGEVRNGHRPKRA